MRKRPQNKKELAKNEEDIIETDSNSLVVHETKLKVCRIHYVNICLVKMLLNYDRATKICHSFFEDNDSSFPQ